MSSDTPRTDALIQAVGRRRLALVSGELAELCLKLERENNQLRAKVGELEQDKARLQEKLDDINDRARDV